MSDRYGSIYREPSKAWRLGYAVAEFITLVLLFIGLPLSVVLWATILGVPLK